MKIRELVEYLRQFDPEKEVWVIYESWVAYPAEFTPADADAATKFNSDGVHQGDLIMEVG